MKIPDEIKATAERWKRGMYRLGHDGTSQERRDAAKLATYFCHELTLREEQEREQDLPISGSWVEPGSDNLKR